MMTYLNTCHTRFNYKFNVTKAMDVAHVDQLLHGQVAIELSHEQCCKTYVYFKRENNELSGNCSLQVLNMGSYVKHHMDKYKHQRQTVQAF